MGNEVPPWAVPIEEVPGAQDHSRWLSSDFSRLLDRHYAAERARQPLIQDVVIVGSGYGGAMAAAQLSGLADSTGRALSVCVLERGKEWVRGMFPSSMQEMPTQLRTHRADTDETSGDLQGLFDIRMGPDVTVVAANGLGGGSLINAGVMATPSWGSFQHRLPASVVNSLTPAYMDAVRQRLGASDANGHNTIARHPRAASGTRKTRVLEQMQDPSVGAAFSHAPITVEMTGGVNPDGVRMNACTLCGDCMTGCNVGAKKSLDTNLLVQAWRKGAQIYTGASVLRINRVEGPRVDGRRTGHWEIETVYTDLSMRRRHSAVWLRARHLILSAGALGSPEILMRSQTRYGLNFSKRLGQQFSCNGDNIAAFHQTDLPANAVAREFIPLHKRSVGPTITGMIDVPAQGERPGFLIQEFAVPAALKAMFDEVVTTANMLHALPHKPPLDPFSDAVDGEKEPHQGFRDPLAVDPRAMAHTLLVGVIGHDESSGQLVLQERPRMKNETALQGHVVVRWPDARHSLQLENAWKQARAMATARLGEDTVPLPNPAWLLLPDQLSDLVQGARGPVLTVHPLGGCPIGMDKDTGAVDEYGRVFDDNREDGFHEGLFVMDASIIPASLGANPGLTIASLAQRACDHLVSSSGWTPVPQAGLAVRQLSPRPQFRAPEKCTPPRPAPTRVELMERLKGPVKVAGRDYMAELTLAYGPISLRSLANRAGRTLKITPRQDHLCRLRLYDSKTWDSDGINFASEHERDRAAALTADVRGSFTVLQSLPEWRWLRKLRALFWWFVNRGARDLYQEGWKKALSRLSGSGSFLNLAERSGEVRVFEYALDLENVVSGNASLGQWFRHGRIEGCKTVTYNRRANPWRQLTELRLSSFPGAQSDGNVLVYDQRFVAGQGVPLARIVSQANQAVALVEMARVAAYSLRMMLNTHLWVFRAPDTQPEPVKPELLPAAIEGLHAPYIEEIEVDAPRNGIAVRVRLTHYRRAIDHPKGPAPPLVLIHGYSASGSTYTHRSVPMPMAKFFALQGRDVWVLDLRTSAGMPSAVLPWHFEDAALADIPVAIARIRAITGAAQVDVFAHCIGAVMLSMALLTDSSNLGRVRKVEPHDKDQPALREHTAELAALRGSVRKVVLSQKGPRLIYSDGNVLRAYLMRVLRKLVLPADYQFRPARLPGLADQVMDRVLSSLPYPDAEYDIENPLPFFFWKKTGWAALRHRMDALYAQDFEARHMDTDTLESLDHLFGPLNLDTVSQGGHFARFNTITNGAGRNEFVTTGRMKTLWPKAGTLSIHASGNGLADPRTLAEMEKLMKEADVPFDQLLFKGLGHQDCLVGKPAQGVFESIEDWL